MEVPAHHPFTLSAGGPGIRKENVRSAALRCLLLLAVIWALASAAACTPEQEVDLLVPLHLSNLPDGLAVSSPLPKDIGISLAGKPAAIGKLKQSDLSYDLDLSEARIGVQAVPIGAEGFRTPKGIRILNMEPTVVSVAVDREVEKKVPVSLTIFGRPANGFLVLDSSVKPQQAVLKGPEAVIAAFQTVLTKPVNINGRSESFKKEVALDLPENIRLVEPEGLIRCDIVIEEKFTTKKFAQVPVDGLGTEGCYSITPPAIDMEISGPQQVLDTLLQTEKFRVYVDLKELPPGVYVRRATIILPVKTALLGVRPELFTIEVRDCGAGK